MVAPHEKAATSFINLLPFHAAARSSSVSERTRRNLPFKLMTHTCAGSGIGDEINDRMAGTIPLNSKRTATDSAMAIRQADGERRNLSLRR